MKENRLSERRQQPAEKPVMDLGGATISALSTSAEGFKLKIQSVGRTEGGATNAVFNPKAPDLATIADPEAREQERQARAERRDTLKAAMKGEIGFQGKKPGKALIAAETPLRSAQAELREAQHAHADPAEIDRLRAEVDALRPAHREALREFRKSPEFAKYKKNMPGKIGLRDITIDGDTIRADAHFVSFPMYTQFSKPEAPSAVLELSEAAGTSMVLRTADNKLILQHRAVAKREIATGKMSRGNGAYPDIPGASAAGTLDAGHETAGRIPGTPDTVDKQFTLANIIKETEEELAVESDELEQLRIVGLGHDRVKPHAEIIILADTQITSDEIKRRSLQERGLDDADFEEKFVEIEASPEAIQTLIAEVKSPLAPTHVAAFAAAGYAMVLERDGQKAAEEWKTQLEQKTQENFRQINQTVAAYYNDHPEALTQIPERYWDKKAPVRNWHGYSPEYTPEEQGLPNLEDELVRTGLHHETRTVVDTAYLFDVDGVLADPITKRVTQPELFDQIIERLEDGKPVCLNTGRSTTWVEKRIVAPLLERIEDKQILEYLVVVGEKGGTWTTYDKDGEAQHNQVDSLEVPDELFDKVQALVAGKYPDAMTVHESGETGRTKETMISIEMTDGFDHGQFKRMQPAFEEELNKILGQNEQWSKYKVDPTSIATDIESKYVGKALGTDRFLQWLRERDIKAESFVAVGDSPSDLEMADELLRRGQTVEFAYVGDPEKLEEAKNEGKVKDPSVIRTVGNFTQGTLRYLEGS